MTDHIPGKSNPVFYAAAIICGVVAGIAHVGIEDPLITALIVVASTMVLGFMRPQRPWIWTLLVGIMVPLVMISARIMGRYANFTRAGLYGSVLLILPGVAGAYGGYFGNKVIGIFFPPNDTQ